MKQNKIHLFVINTIIIISISVMNFSCCCRYYYYYLYTLYILYFTEEEDGTFRHTFDISVPVEYVADSGRVTIFMSGIGTILIYYAIYYSIYFTLNCIID